jgi:selenocysteine-specific translation elongation factor
MSNLNIIIIGPADIAKEIGKKGTSTDITFYNLKKGEATLTIVEPTRYPEKLSSLFYAASLSDIAVVVIEKITASLGECILELQCMQISRGYLILRNYIDISQIQPLIRGTVLEGYTVLPDDMNVLREQLLADAGRIAGKNENEPGIVPIDHHFPVKGIGTVILGSVRAGTIRKHDQVTVFPTGKTVQIRSIQKHDDDVNLASEGDRVGLALKGVEAEDLDRGYILSASADIRCSLEITGIMNIIPYWPEPLKDQMILYAGHWMQFLPCRVHDISVTGDWHSPRVTLVFEKELVFRPGSTIVLHYLEGEKLRIVGTMKPA